MNVTSNALFSVPLTFKEASAFVAEHHRHYVPPVGHKFSVGCAVKGGDGRVIGVCIVGRPVARNLDNGWTLEITRCATDGTKNACSFLYGCARRAAWALGYKRLVTYTLPAEGGASLRAAGYRLIGEAGGGNWNVRSRPRVDTREDLQQRKFRWEAESTENKCFTAQNESISDIGAMEGEK